MRGSGTNVKIFFSLRFIFAQTHRRRRRKKKRRNISLIRVNIFNRRITNFNTHETFAVEFYSFRVALAPLKLFFCCC